MATFTGKDAVLKVGGSPAAIGGILSWDIEEEADDQVDTGLNEEWETRLSGSKLRKRWTGNITYKLDQTAAAQSTLLVGALVAGEFYPSGEGSAQAFKSGSFVILRKSTEAGEDNGNMVYSLAIAGTGTLTQATIA